MSGTAVRRALDRCASAREQMRGKAAEVEQTAFDAGFRTACMELAAAYEAAAEFERRWAEPCRATLRTYAKAAATARSAAEVGRACPGGAD